MRFRKGIKDGIIRPALEKLKVDYYSRPALNNLDRKLEFYLDFDNGTFLEVGANDGYKQSNTYYFERIRNWQGVLIEPIPMLYEQCRKRREKSQVYNYICSNAEDSGSTKTIRYADLMSLVEGSLKDEEKEREHLKKGIEIQKIENSFELEVECKTLSEIIDMSGLTRFDFMSIDVEGFELQVLKGLDLSRHAPTFLLVEVWEHDRENIKAYLNKIYSIEAYLTEKDTLFKRR